MMLRGPVLWTPYEIRSQWAIRALRVVSFSLAATPLHNRIQLALIVLSILIVGLGIPMSSSLSECVRPISFNAPDDPCAILMRRESVSGPPWCLRDNPFIGSCLSSNLG